MVPVYIRVKQLKQSALWNSRNVPTCELVLVIQYPLHSLLHWSVSVSEWSEYCVLDWCHGRMFTACICHTQQWFYRMFILCTAVSLWTLFCYKVKKTISKFGKLQCAWCLPSAELLKWKLYHQLEEMLWILILSCAIWSMIHRGCHQVYVMM